MTAHLLHANTVAGAPSTLVAIFDHTTVPSVASSTTIRNRSRRERYIAGRIKYPTRGGDIRLYRRLRASRQRYGDASPSTDLSIFFMSRSAAATPLRIV